MKYFLEITKSSWLPKSNTKMVHEDEQGRLFLGPPISTVADEIVIVEATDCLMNDGYYHIIKVVGRTRKSGQSLDEKEL